MQFDIDDEDNDVNSGDLTTAHTLGRDVNTEHHTATVNAEVHGTSARLQSGRHRNDLQSGPLLTFDIDDSDVPALDYSQHRRIEGAPAATPMQFDIDDEDDADADADADAAADDTGTPAAAPAFGQSVHQGTQAHSYTKRLQSM